MWRVWRVDSRGQNKDKSWYVKMSVKAYLLSYNQFKFGFDETGRK